MSAQPFDVCGDLPQGVTVLEASAGTGKTFTIAALAARYVAAGVPLDDLLVVTFTRMATGELRERVRERLIRAERVLDDALAGVPPPPTTTSARCWPPARTRRCGSAATAWPAPSPPSTPRRSPPPTASVSKRSAASASPATSVTTARSSRRVEDLVEEVVDDLYVRAFRGEQPFLSRDQAREIALAAISNPSARLVPENADRGSDPARRVALAKAARLEVERRKRHAQIMTFDDLLTRLDDALTGAGGDAVADRLRARYKVVLVDEFQDTDPVQWRIMQRAFDHPGGTLVLIGDPKQAIYAFRGADVYAYLEARKRATAEHTLAVNWRSDQGLITALDGLFGSAQLGHPGITYREVHATPANESARLSGAPVAAPLRVRVVDRTPADRRADEEPLREGRQRPRARRARRGGRHREAARLGRADREARRRRRRHRPAHRAPGRRRRARAPQPRRHAGPRPARSRRRPRRHQRRRERLRLRRGPRLAAAARGAGAPVVRPARPQRGAHDAARVERRARGHRGRGRLGGRPPPPARLGADPADRGRRVAASRRSPCRSSSPGACWPSRPGSAT